METVPPVFTNALSGEWRRVGDLDTTGGPLRALHTDGTLRDNSKWCQNPQYHLALADSFSKEEVYLKVVLRRTDNKNAHRGGAAGIKGGAMTASAAADQKKLDATVGLVICKAEQLEEANATKVKKRQPRLNKLGEVSDIKLFIKSSLSNSTLYS